MEEFEDFVRRVYYAKYAFEERGNTINYSTRLFMNQHTYNAGLEYNKNIGASVLLTMVGLPISIASNIPDFTAYIANEF